MIPRDTCMGKVVLISGHDARDSTKKQPLKISIRKKVLAFFLFVC